MIDPIQVLIEQMTLEEKAALCTGANFWTTTALERLNIPKMIVSDGPHGVRRVRDANSLTQESLPATCFPTASCLAATWNLDLIRKMGEALAEECIALNVDIILGPGVNMKRSPLGGRNFEYFSEDPFLAAELSVSFILGVQSLGVGTSIKHFAANNQEFQRFTINAKVDERVLREIYLPAFEMAVKKAQPWTVMCSYNKINGRYASENHHLLTEILKDEWGFEGLVVSDWGAVRDRVSALKAGLDWEMPGPQEGHVQAVIEAVRSGELDEALLNESVRRILRIVFKTRLTPKQGTFDALAHHQLAHQLAAEGMVLLKNNGLLPLKEQKQIAVIGRASRQAYFQGGGSSHINPTKVAIPLEEIKNLSGFAQLTYAEGYPGDDSFRQDLIDQAVSLAQSADVALLFISLPVTKECEGYDRIDLQLTTQQIALIEAVSEVQPNSVVVLNNGAPVVMQPWIEQVAAVLEGWMMGQAGGEAIADILFGRVNPSGKLAETFPMKLSDTPSFINFPGEAGQVTYGEGLFIGYRYYDAKQMPVQFPFGYGLSYTTFEYRNARVTEETFKDIDGITVSVDVTNTGHYTGKEIVQVYAHDQKSELVRPEKELKGFAKVELEPGETKTVSIPLDFRSFAYFHPRYNRWITEDGQFDLLIASSAADIRQSITVTLQSTQQLPCILNQESTLCEWLNDLHGKELVAPIYDLIVRIVRKDQTSSEPGDGSGIGMDMMDMYMDMPLLSVLSFLRKDLPTRPEEIVTDLLIKACA